MHKEMKNENESMAEDPSTWVDRYGDTLYRFALVRLKNPEVAEDVVQETFVAALRSLKRFKGQSTVKTWLTGILKHKIIDHIRRQSREKPMEHINGYADAVDDLFNDRGGWLIRPSRWRINPMMAYEQKEFMDVFYKCMAEVPQRLADAFSMRELEGLSTEEICQALGISATNCWTMLYRARMYLRRCLEASWFDQRPGEE